MATETHLMNKAGLWLVTTGVPPQRWFCRRTALMHVSSDSSGLGVSGYTGMFDLRLMLDSRVIDAEEPRSHAATMSQAPVTFEAPVGRAAW